MPTAAQTAALMAAPRGSSSQRCHGHSVLPAGRLRCSRAHTAFATGQPQNAWSRKRGRHAPFRCHPRWRPPARAGLALGPAQPSPLLLQPDTMPVCLSVSRCLSHGLLLASSDHIMTRPTLHAVRTQVMPRLTFLRLHQCIYLHPCQGAPAVSCPLLQCPLLCRSAEHATSGDDPVAVDSVLRHGARAVCALQLIVVLPIYQKQHRPHHMASQGCAECESTANSSVHNLDPASLAHAPCPKH